MAPLRRRGRFARLAVFSLVAFAAALNARAWAGQVTLGNSDTGNFDIKLVSYSEIPFRTVIRQQFDYSCGSAALATLLRYHYSRHTSEADIFKAMYDVGDQAQIQKVGFSLLDMKKYLASIGYQADGFRVSLTELGQVGTPAIALIQLGSYKHFVVIKGVVGDSVLVGDPALGLRTFRAADFQKVWNGIAFVVHDSPAAPAPVFNSREDWQRWVDFHPLAAATTIQPLTPFLRDLRVIYQIRPNQNLPSPLAQGGLQ
jgi:predicted double-glycine peptidase